MLSQHGVGSPFSCHSRAPPAAANRVVPGSGGAVGGRSPQLHAQQGDGGEGGRGVAAIGQLRAVAAREREQRGGRGMPPLRRGTLAALPAGESRQHNVGWRGFCEVGHAHGGCLAPRLACGAPALAWPFRRGIHWCQSAWTCESHARQPGRARSGWARLGPVGARVLAAAAGRIAQQAAGHASLARRRRQPRRGCGPGRDAARGERGAQGGRGGVVGASAGLRAAGGAADAAQCGCCRRMGTVGAACPAAPGGRHSAGTLRQGLRQRAWPLQHCRRWSCQLCKAAHAAVCRRWLPVAILLWHARQLRGGRSRNREACICIRSAACPASAAQPAGRAATVLQQSRRGRAGRLLHLLGAFSMPPGPASVVDRLVNSP